MLLVLILLFLITSVSAEKVTLKIGESYTDEDKNITLLKIEGTKTLACVNNQKGIIAKNKRVDINGVILEIKTIYSNNSVKFDIEVPSCYKCTCTGDCLNQLCQEIQEPEPKPLTQNQQENNTPSEKTEIIETPNISVISIIAVILIILVSILGIYILWKKIT